MNRERIRETLSRLKISLLFWATVWGVWNLLMGHKIPVITPIPLSPTVKLAIPFTLTRWSDLAAAPLLSALIGYLENGPPHTQLPLERTTDYRRRRNANIAIAFVAMLSGVAFALLDFLFASVAAMIIAGAVLFLMRKQFASLYAMVWFWSGTGLIMGFAVALAGIFAFLIGFLVVALLAWSTWHIAEWATAQLIWWEGRP